MKPMADPFCGKIRRLIGQKSLPSGTPFSLWIFGAIKGIGTIAHGARPKMEAQRFTPASTTKSNHGRLDRPTGSKHSSETPLIQTASPND